MSISYTSPMYEECTWSLGRNTLDHYCMNATENQMIYRTDVLSSVWNYCKPKKGILCIIQLQTQIASFVFLTNE